jgi:hypothetical protein
MATAARVEATSKSAADPADKQRNPLSSFCWVFVLPKPQNTPAGASESSVSLVITPPVLQHLLVPEAPI